MSCRLHDAPLSREAKCFFVFQDTPCCFLGNKDFDRLRTVSRYCGNRVFPEMKGKLDDVRLRSAADDAESEIEHEEIKYL
ncbi:MAG: hypothetical protein RR955_03885 [Raoultibacter sp.]